MTNKKEDFDVTVLPVLTSPFPSTGSCPVFGLLVPFAELDKTRPVCADGIGMVVIRQIRSTVEALNKPLSVKPDAGAAVAGRLRVILKGNRTPGGRTAAAARAFCNSAGDAEGHWCKAVGVRPTDILPSPHTSPLTGRR